MNGQRPRTGQGQPYGLTLSCRSLNGTRNRTAVVRERDTERDTSKRERDTERDTERTAVGRAERDTERDKLASKEGAS